MEHKKNENEYKNEIEERDEYELVDANVLCHVDDFSYLLYDDDDTLVYDADSNLIGRLEDLFDFDEMDPRLKEYLDFDEFDD